MKTIFWNTDTQYDFMRKDGALYVEGAEIVEDNLRKLTNLARLKGVVVVNTADWHDENTQEISVTPDFRTTFPPHCMQNTHGARFIPATDPRDPYILNWNQNDIDESVVRSYSNLVLRKDKFDAFAGNPHSDKVVALLKPDRAIVYGVATNVCVNDAVLGLLERKVAVYVPTDAIKELPGLPLPYNTWQEKGAILTTTEGVYDLLRGTA